LLPVADDVAVRVWRSAWEWLPVDRNLGMFRFVWEEVLGATFLASALLLVALVLV
jgi:hypothetical protein